VDVEKLLETIELIRCWYEAWDGRVYVGFSGGWDSTVLLHIVRSIYPNIPAVFMNTLIEFPEIVKFARSRENVVELRPRIAFKQVIAKYGWPIVSKDVATAISRYRNTKRADQKEYRLYGRWENGKHLTAGMIPKKWQFLINAPFRISDECCAFLKHGPLKRFAKKKQAHPMLGIMREDSNLRQRHLNRFGCNMYDKKEPISWPMAHWTKANIMEYTKLFGVEICEVYQMGYDRTGCMFCMFGLEKEAKNTGSNRFQKMKRTHPKHWEACIKKMGGGKVLDYLGIPFE